VFGNLSVLKPVQVVIGGGALSKGAFTHHEHEITFPQHSVKSFVLHRHTLPGQGLQPCDQAGEPVGNKCVVLDVIVVVKIAWKFVPAAIQQVIHVGLHQGLIELSLVEIGRDGRAIRHRVAARTRLGGGLLQVVPVLHDLSFFKSENIEAYPGTADVVFRVGKDKIAVSENTNGIDLGSALGKRFQPFAKSRQAIRDAQVVLNIFIGIDGREWAAVTRLRTLKQFDDLPREIVQH
jgi:hypothetical protein